MNFCNHLQNKMNSIINLPAHITQLQLTLSSLWPTLFHLYSTHFPTTTIPSCFEANSKLKISRGFFLNRLSLMSESLSSKWDLGVGQYNRSKLHLLFETYKALIFSLAVKDTSFGI